MQRTYPEINLQQGERAWRFGWIDILVAISIFLLLWLVISLSGDMRVSFDEVHPPAFSLDVTRIPYYTARTVLRMFIAFFAALLFTIIYGYIAAKSVRARKVMLPMLDILQSVPVLGFLPITVAGFLTLFPHSLLGLECASIFLIFTAQAWNMTFGFYHSLITIPPQLQEAASVYRLNRWQRLTSLELPASAIGLMWNSMMSFGGGWFFVAQSEAISVHNQNVKLPGLGSYMAAAVDAGDTRAAIYAILAMIVTIVLIDQLVWRPLVAWAEKFKIEQTESADTQTSWVLDLLYGSYLINWFSEKVLEPFQRSVQNFFAYTSQALTEVVEETPRTIWFHLKKILKWLIAAGFFGAAIYLIFALSTQIHALTIPQMGHIVWLGFLTLTRVLVMTILATLLWTPIGVWIGSKPKVAKFAQPLAQILASFPVNMTFPFVVTFFIMHNISINYGSVLLIALGTQWYILFNVIAGAMAIPTDLKEAAGIFGLQHWRKWKTLIIPAIFPYWVTGAVTAAGGAWNASIVAEFATWGQHKLQAQGLGAAIAQATETGDHAKLYFSIVVMSLFVVVINRVLWRHLYDLAERRFKLT